MKRNLGDEGGWKNFVRWPWTVYSNFGENHKILALDRGLTMAKELDIKKLINNMDSQMAVQHTLLWVNVMTYLKHYYREVDKAADWLVNRGY